MSEELFITKNNHLEEEIETARIFYNGGIGIMRKLSRGLDDLRYGRGKLEFMAVPILLLSHSFERMIKCLLCAILMKKDGSFYEQPYIYKPPKGHDLEYLLNRLIKIVSDKRYSSVFSELKSEIDYLRNDEALKLVIKTLSDFGLGDRYYNLDFVLKGKSDQKSPIIAWDIIEMNLLLNTRDFDDVRRMSPSEIAIETQKEVVKAAEQIFRILERMYEIQQKRIV
jgi:hypothetical protein